MTTIARSFTSIAVAFTITIASPAIAIAEPQDSRGLVWMAASNSEPSISNQWGRLSMRDGVITFAGNDVEWQVAVADIRRAAISTESDKLIVIETVRDERYYVAILGQNMTIQPPRKALNVIRGAQRVSAGRR